MKVRVSGAGVPKIAMRAPRPSYSGWASKKRSTPISFLGMSEAKKVDSFSLNSRREEPSFFLLLLLLLLSPVEVREEQGIGLWAIRWRFDEMPVEGGSSLKVCARSLCCGVRPSGVMKERNVRVGFWLPCVEVSQGRVFW